MLWNTKEESEVLSCHFCYFVDVIDNLLRATVVADAIDNWHRATVVADAIENWQS